MKKVAIMTWYSYNNYGSVLQSFALCSTIKKIGYEPSLINYNPNERVRINYSFSSNLGKNIKRIHSFFNNKILYPKTVSDYSKYDEFRNKYLNITSP